MHAHNNEYAAAVAAVNVPLTAAVPACLRWYCSDRQGNHWHEAAAAALTEHRLDPMRCHHLHLVCKRTCMHAHAPGQRERAKCRISVAARCCGHTALGKLVSGVPGSSSVEGVRIAPPLSPSFPPQPATPPPPRPRSTPGPSACGLHASSVTGAALATLSSRRPSLAGRFHPAPRRT